MRHFSPLVVLAIWAALALGTQRWPSIATANREGWGGDMIAYEVIARAAPSFPDQPVRRAFAERFPAHWIAGVLSDGTGVSLEVVYRVLSMLTLAALVLVLHLALRRATLGKAGYGLALGAFVVSAYPLHFLLAAPGFLADGVFLLGLAVSLLGFVRTRLALVVGGLMLAAVGRQTALPVAVVAAAWIAFRPVFPTLRWRAAAATAFAPLAVYAGLRAAADTFAFSPDTPGGNTVIGFMTSGQAFVEHVGKTALGVVVLSALVLGAWLRTRQPLPWLLILLATTVVVQPLVLGPGAVHPGNEPRLAALAAPALVVAAALLLGRAVLTWAETLLLGAAIALASLHPRYTHAPWASWTWVVLELAAAMTIVIVLGRRRLRYARLM